MYTCDLTGSRKSKMVASKPELIFTHLSHISAQASHVEVHFTPFTVRAGVDILIAYSSSHLKIIQHLEPSF